MDNFHVFNNKTLHCRTAALIIYIINGNVKLMSLTIRAHCKDYSYINQITGCLDLALKLTPP